MKIQNKLSMYLKNKVKPYFSMRELRDTIYSKVPQDKMLFNGKEIEYLFHSYNNFGITERAIELPIVKSYLEQCEFEKVLEIGNVSKYYYGYLSSLFKKHDVVDKNENCYDVICSDIAKYKCQKDYNLIFSISTFEHMDSDNGNNKNYSKLTPIKCTIAIDNIIYCYEKLLKKGGTFVITAPLHYTSEWDLTYKRIESEFNFFSIKKYLFKKVEECKWIQLKDNNAYPAKVPQDGFPWKYANFLSVIEIVKE